MAGFSKPGLAPEKMAWQGLAPETGLRKLTQGKICLPHCTSRSAQGRWGGEGLGVGSPEERGGGGGRKQVLSGASNIQVMEANERARRGGGGQPYDYLVTRHRRRPG